MLVKIFAYSLVLVSAYMFYLGFLIPGALIFCFGGWLAGKLYFSLRSLGVVMLVCAVATGFHHGFSVPVIVVAVLGFLLANLSGRRQRRRRRSKRGEDDDGWGFDFDDFDFFGDDGDGGGFDGGGD